MKRKAKEYEIAVGKRDSLSGRDIIIQYGGNVVAVVRLSAAMGLGIRMETYRPMFEVTVVQMPEELRPLTRRERGDAR